MRARLVVVAIAVTSMVAIAFLVPLAGLTRNLAADRERVSAENDAESIARVLVSVPPESLRVAIDAGGDAYGITDRDVSIVLEDGTVIGDPLDQDEDLSAAFGGASFRQPVEGGEAVYLPIVTAEGTAVVRVVADEAAMTDGVARTWGILLALGAVLVLIAVAVADRLGRSFVRPVEDLSDAAEKLGGGDLDARVEPSGPPEIQEVGETFNRLASEVEQLIQAEREDAADLAHRLRTPLTAARLTADSLPEGEERDLMIADLDELERSIDFVIMEARRPVRQVTAADTDVIAVSAERADFWSPLATDEDRDFSSTLPTGHAMVAAPRKDLEAALDALLGNVFAHTPPGTSLRLVVTRTENAVVVLVSDDGPGWPAGLDPERRGTSGASSTGLGLDIARRTAESTGGSLRTARSPQGGAAVTVTLPLSGGMS